MDVFLKTLLSKKLLTFIGTLIGVSTGWIPAEFATEALLGAGGYSIGQGLADFGKHAK